MNHKVYILYSSKDAEIAMQICEAIESNDIKCWIASRDLDAQKDTIEQTAFAIECAEHIVLIFSKNALESHEVKLAIGLSRTKDLIVLNVDGANLGPDIFLGMDKPKAVFKGTSDKFELKIPSLNVNETRHSTSKYVYLSYDDVDLENVASQIKQYKGMGVNFKHQLDTKIKDSSLLIAFISKDSSKSSKIKEDIKSAISNDVGIMMIHLDDCETDFGRMFNLKYGSKFKKAIKYSIHKQEMDELTYIDKCDEIFQLFSVKKVT